MPFQQIQYLGGGQFGDVWLEQDQALERLCAAKHLDTSLLAPGTESFAEARAMIAAQHENDPGVLKPLAARDSNLR